MTAWMGRRLLAPIALAWIAPGSPAQTLARFVPTAPPATGPLELCFAREDPRGVELQPWPAQGIGWLFLRAEGTQHNFDALVPLAEDPTRLRLEREGPGVQLVGWDLPPRIESLDVGTLRVFLAARSGRTAPPALEALAGDRTVSVLRLESLALVARPAEDALDGAPSETATSKSGQRMELRALFDPSSLPAGGDFAFKLYLPEGGKEHVLCRAVHLEGRESRALELAADGSLRARLEQPGPWMIEATRLRALDGGGEAALELASSTLVFVVRPAPPRTKEGGR